MVVLISVSHGAPGAQVSFDDRLQGWIEQDLEHAAGDFLVQRAEGWFAYQLAAVVDDAELGMSDIVRALGFLQHPLPSGLHRAPVAEIMSWAGAHWTPATLPQARTIELTA